MKLPSIVGRIPESVEIGFKMLAGRRPALMSRPYSNALRARVVGAVEHGGMSRHQAAAHFGVAISTAINWVKRFRQTASVAPGQMEGHKPRTLSGAHRDWLIARCRDRAFTLRGLVAELAVERGLVVDYLFSPSL
jgi:putative transposase